MRARAAGLVAVAALGLSYSLAFALSGTGARAPVAKPAATGSEPVNLANLLERPLFSPGRRARLVDMKQPPPPAPLSAPHLTGIIKAPSVEIAIFHPLGSAASVAVTPGAQIDGWLVQNIANHEVTLARAGTTLTVSMRLATQDTETESSGASPPQESGLRPGETWSTYIRRTFIHGSP